MKTLVFILAMFLSSFGFSQGLIDGYFKGKGNADVAVSAFYQTSQNFFAGTNKIKLSRNIFSLGAFAEYGITPKWDVIANIPFINGQLQDGAIATKYELIKTQIGGRDFSVIPALAISFPLSNYATETSQAVGQRATVFAPKLVLQHNLPGGLFLQIQGGYNYALSPVASSLPISAKIGGSFGKLYADVWFDFQQGFGDKDYLGTVPYNSFREFVVNHQRVGGVFYYGLKEKLGAFINYSYTFNGRNTAEAIGVGTGVVFKLSH